MSLEQKKIMVVKIGSSTLVTGEGKLDTAYLATLASQISGLRQRGWSPIIVTSGAVACGLEALGISMRPSDTPSLQAAASVGTNILVSSYARAFKAHDMLTSLVLITRQVTADREQYLHVRDTLERLLDLEVVPLINENDTVSTHEIQFGDNDRLSAIVAALIGADLLILMSDIDGLYSKDPHKNPDARFIGLVEEITPELIGMGGGSGSDVGTGGMAAKLAAARIATDSGSDMIICNADDVNVIHELVNGEEKGTLFLAHPNRDFDLMDYINTKYEI